MSSKRPPVKIKFRFNLETGTIEQFIVDDNAAGASEEYHDRVALTVGDLLARKVEVKDAGPRYNLPQTEEKLASKKIAEPELDKAAD
jgi:hypothetical protein